MTIDKYPSLASFAQKLEELGKPDKVILCREDFEPIWDRTDPKVHFCTSEGLHYLFFSGCRIECGPWLKRPVIFDKIVDLSKERIWEEDLI